MFPDPAAENHCVNPVKLRCVSTNLSRDPVAEYIHSQLGPLIAPRQQYFHIAAVRNTRQPAVGVHPRLHAGVRDIFALHQIQDHTRVNIPGAVSHRHPRKRGKAHCGCNGFSAPQSRQTASRPQMRHDDPPAGCSGVQLSKLPQKGCIREPVKPISPHPLHKITPRNRQHLRRHRHRVVEHGIKTCDRAGTRQHGVACVYESQFHGQMLRIKFN